MSLVFLLFSTWVIADWWTHAPADVAKTYVGRSKCIQCHQKQAELFKDSHHDRAMDHATAASVLGDFNDVKFTHHDVTSRMFKKDGQFFVHTEGPDGKMADFHIKYVLGVEPLQQYMIEFDPPKDAKANEVGRLQVLRISWDTVKKQWFYLPPPDVSEKLDHNDELHWTGIGQRWNSMCAECHTTNLQKNFDHRKGTYRTSYSEIDVSCESCHGPGSLHVKLAKSRSFFWDRKHGYGLAKLKDKANSLPQIHTCARCHARQTKIAPNFKAGDNYYDHYANSLLMRNIYHEDGQVLDEDYVFGSFIQSKMFHKGIRCTDCHDPHSARLIHKGNQVCTSCHTHSAAKYDAVLHHRHKVGSKGTACVECHMPSTTYMEVDPRRDHSLRIPRPDVSAKWGTPNACTSCHLDRAKLPAKKRAGLKDYAAWIRAARKDPEVRAELKKIDLWAAKHVKEWHGDKKKRDPDNHFAGAFARGWVGDPTAVDALKRVSRDQARPAIIRASALLQLGQMSFADLFEHSVPAMKDPDPQVRAVAIGNIGPLIPLLRDARSDDQIPPQMWETTESLLKKVAPALHDKSRFVRTEAARVLARVPIEIVNKMVSRDDSLALVDALEELKDRYLLENDRAESHMTRGIHFESQRDDSSARKAYETAIRVEPTRIGPRQNLAATMDRIARRKQQQVQQLAIQSRMQGKKLTDNPAFQRQIKPIIEEIAKLQEGAKELRLQEMALLGRRARLLKTSAESQFDHGMFLSLFNHVKEAEAAIQRAVKLEPNVPQYQMGLAMFYQKYQRWGEALKAVRKLRQLRPKDRSYEALEKEIEGQAANAQTPKAPGGRSSR